MSEQKLWRDLEIGELILPTDEVMDSRHGVLQWKSCYNHSAEPLDAIHVPHRRRVPASPIIRDARTDPPKESDGEPGTGCIVAVIKGSRHWVKVYWASTVVLRWFALPTIPEPEKTEAEIAFDEAQKAFASQKYKEAVDWGSFSKGYEMGKAAK